MYTIFVHVKRWFCWVFQTKRFKAGAFEDFFYYPCIARRGLSVRNSLFAPTLESVSTDCVVLVCVVCSQSTYTICTLVGGIDETVFRSKRPPFASVTVLERRPWTTGGNENNNNTNMYIIHNYDCDSVIYSFCVVRLSTTAAQWYEKFPYKQLQYKSLFSRFIYFFVFVQ